jgi:hypothetical protein
MNVQISRFGLILSGLYLITLASILYITYFVPSRCGLYCPMLAIFIAPLPWSLIYMPLLSFLQLTNAMHIFYAISVCVNIVLLYLLGKHLGNNVYSDFTKQRLSSSWKKRA